MKYSCFLLFLLSADLATGRRHDATTIRRKLQQPSARLELGELVFYDDMPSGGYPVCTGQCTQDADCLSGLRCFERTQQESVPGCTGMGVQSLNYCYAESNDYSSPDFAPPPPGLGSQYYFFNELHRPLDCEYYASDIDEEAPVPYEGAAGVGGASDLLYGQNTYIYVVDESGSTDNFQVGACGDASGDGTTFDILDCEILAIEQVNLAAILGGNVDLAGLVSFSSTGTIHQTLIEPWVKDKPQDRDPKIVQELRKLEAGGATNFEAGIEKACELARSPANNNPNTIIIMLSDGRPNRGNSTEDLVRNNCGGATVHTYAVTSRADCDDVDENNLLPGDSPDTLRQIASFTGGTCTRVVDVTTLPDMLIQMERTTLDFVEITADNGNSVQTANGVNFSPIAPAFEGPQDITYSGTLNLGPGDYQVCSTAASSSSGMAEAVSVCKQVIVMNIVGSPPTQTINPVLQQNADVLFTVSVLGNAPGCGSRDGLSVELRVFGPGRLIPPVIVQTGPGGTLDYSLPPPPNPGTDSVDTIQACYQDFYGNDACDTVTVRWVVPSSSPSEQPSPFPTPAPTPVPTPLPTPAITDRPTPSPTLGPRTPDLPPSQCTPTPFLGGTFTSSECFTNPLCRPYRYSDFCQPSESFLDLIKARRNAYTTDAVGLFAQGWWYPAVEDKLAAKIFAREENIPTAQLYYCSDDLTDIDTWVVPPLAVVGGFVIKALGFHSGMGIFVFPNGFDNIELLSGLVKSRSQVRMALSTLGATHFIIEEYIPGPDSLSVLPDEYKIHVFGGEIGSIVYSTRRGSGCECFAELDENWNRVDNHGCFRPAGHSAFMTVNGQQCTRIDFDNGPLMSVKGLDFCSHLLTAPSGLADILDLAQRIGQRLGVYMRVDILVDGNGRILLNELTPGHTNGRVHCSARTDQDGCVDSCFLGRLWSMNGGNPLHGGPFTTIPTGLVDWTTADWSDKCADYLLGP